MSTQAIAARARQLRSELSNPMKTSGGLLILAGGEDQVHITLSFSTYSMVHSLFAAAIGCYDDDVTLAGKLEELGNSVRAKVCNAARKCTIELPGLDEPIEITEDESQTVLLFLTWVLSGDLEELQDLEDEAVPYQNEDGSTNFAPGGEG